MTGAPSRPEVRIRRALPADALTLSIIGQGLFFESFADSHRNEDLTEHCAAHHSVELYRRWLVEPDHALWLATIAQTGAAIGYVALTPRDTPLDDARATDIELRRIYVFHRFAGMGIGRALMQTALAHARERSATRVLLSVYEHNGEAIGFYRELGFVPIGRRLYRVGTTDFPDLILARAP